MRDAQVEPATEQRSAMTRGLCPPAGEGGAGRSDSAVDLSRTDGWDGANRLAGRGVRDGDGAAGGGVNPRAVHETLLTKEVGVGQGMNTR